FFFFQAEDGIRDRNVTGVQTCALPIFIDSSKNFLFTNIFKSAPDKKFTAQFVDNRKAYYDEVKNLASDRDGLFYVVGSDEFLKQNIEVLLDQGIKSDQIILDKHERRLPEFLAV